MASSSKSLGKYFYIRSKLNPNLLLEIQDAIDKPGTEVVTSEPRGDIDGNDHQLWFQDHQTNTIRSKLNGYCMDNKDDRLVAYPFQKGSSTQLWDFVDEKLQQHNDFESVLGVVEDSDEQGANVQLGADEERPGQGWTLEYRPAQYFYIRMQDSPEKVLDVAKANPKPGAKACVWQDKGKMDDNQLWYEDERGIIHCKLNGFALDTSGKDATMLPYDASNPSMQWVISGNTIINRHSPTDVLQVKKGGMFSAASIQVAEFDSSPEQMWSFEYIPDQSQSLNHAGNGKHFYLRNRWCGLVMELKDTSGDPGTELVTGYRTADLKLGEHQLFFQDDPTGTIRSALNDYCMDIQDDVVVMNPYDPYTKSQQWRKFGRKVQNRHKPDQVLQVSEGNMDPGTNIVAAEYSADEEQHWEVTNITAKCFHIMSKMSGRVIDVKGDKAVAGAKLIMYDKKGTISANQLWYEDERGVIRSKLNGYVMDASDKGARLVLKPYDPTNEMQQWVVIGDRIQNKVQGKLVLDIEGAKSTNGAAVCAYKFHGADNQKWRFEYM